MLRKLRQILRALRSRRRFTSEFERNFTSRYVTTFCETHFGRTLRLRLRLRLRLDLRPLVKLGPDFFSSRNRKYSFFSLLGEIYKKAILDLITVL